MTASQSPVRLFIIVIFSVFVTEAFIMFILSFLPPLSTWMWAMLDATLLIILLSPAIYFFVFQPLILHITQRKQAEEETKIAYSELNQIFSTAADGMRLIDKDFNILRVNDTFSSLSGISSDEAIGKKCYEVFHGPMCFTPDCPLTRILGGEKRVEYEVEKERKDGTKIPCIVTGTPFQGPDGNLIGIVEDFKDITIHKQAEQAIRESEERFRSISTSAQDGILMIDNEGNISYWNEAAERIFGYTKEEAIGKEAHILLGPERYLEAYRKGFSKFKETGQGPVIGKTLELTAIRKGGIEFPIELSVSGVKVQGKWHSIGILRDITERKQAEREVQSLKQQMEFILGTTKTGLDIIDSEFNIRYIDPEWKKVYGDPTGKKCYEYFMGRSEMCLGCGIPKAIETKTITVREEVLVKEGNRPIQVTTIPFQNEKGEWLVAEVNVDITDRKKLEEQLLQAQKMEAVGQLAGGIAHDFNNILTAIIGFGNLLKMEMGTHDPLSNYVTQILNSAERAANLTHALLAFSRKQIINPRPINLNRIIIALEKLLSRIIGEDIELSTLLTDKELFVMADSTQMEQVLMNLAANARDAMPDGGSLTIRTEIVQFDYEYIKAHGYGKPGHYALISIEDTGQGMDASTRERIFEPFYTTKDVGKGTGLGLAMVYGIIKQHDGYINVYSEPGKGTTFKIYLPLIKSKTEEEKIADLHVVTTGTETVLVAEDDKQVRALIKHVLEGSGYQVMEAEDGEEAMRIFNENKDKIQLLILDVIMPKKNGKEVYDEIKKIRPDIKAIFTSGYNAEIIHKKGILEKGFGFVIKPSSPQELLKKVREVLDGHPSTSQS
ncbi:MAG: PAS domain S-box protein [Nitrospirota bacterium]